MQVSVIFTSKSKRLIVDMLESALSLVAPYEWQGLYIPLLPEHMRIGVMHSPFPFIVGWVDQNGNTNVMDGVDVHKYSLPRLIFNLDDGTIIGARKTLRFGHEYYELDSDIAPPLPSQKRVEHLFFLADLYKPRDQCWTTQHWIEPAKFYDNSSNSRQRILEIRWAVTSILIELFKNLRQCTSIQQSPASSVASKDNVRSCVLNREMFLATCDHEPLIKHILETQNFRCFFEDHIVNGGSFNQWCFPKVENRMLRMMRNKNNRFRFQGLLFKAKVGTETDCWKLRYFKMINSPVIEYYDVPKDVASAIKQGEYDKTFGGQRYKQYCSHSHGQLKGKFVIEDGCKVIIPKVKNQFLPNLFGLKKFKTLFQFQIRNPDKGGKRRSLLTCCAITWEDRRRWIDHLQASCIINNEFLEQVRVSYKTRTTHSDRSLVSKVRSWCYDVCAGCSVV